MAKARDLGNNGCGEVGWARGGGAAIAAWLAAVAASFLANRSATKRNPVTPRIQPAGYGVERQANSLFALVGRHGVH